MRDRMPRRLSRRAWLGFGLTTVLVVLGIAVSAHFSDAAPAASPVRRAEPPTTRAPGPSPTPQDVIQLRSAEVTRALATVNRQHRTVRTAERRLRALPSERRTPEVTAALRRLRQQDRALGAQAASLRRRVAAATTYRRSTAEQRRIDNSLADVERAYAALRRLPAGSMTPYLRTARGRLADRRSALRRDRAELKEKVARLEKLLTAELPRAATAKK